MRENKVISNENHPTVQRADVLLNRLWALISEDLTCKVGPETLLSRV